MESGNLIEIFKGKYIMSSVDNDTNILIDKKEAVVTTALSEKKLLTTEKVTTSDEVLEFRIFVPNPGGVPDLGSEKH